VTTDRTDETPADVDLAAEPHLDLGTTGLRRGPRHAVTTTPPPVAGSARRTTTIDVARPDGLLGRCAIEVRGRDVLLDGDGRLRVLDEVAVTVDVDPAGRVRRIAGGPADALLAPLVGVNLRSGYGRLLAGVLADELDRRALVASLFEDVSAALLVSGYAPLRAGLFPADPATADRQADAMGDICVGWESGGPLHRVLAEEGRSAVPLGPSAPPLERAHLDGWHDLPALAADTVRRRRSLDVTPRRGGAGVGLRAHFRDSHEGGEAEAVMHEYAVDAVVEGGVHDGRVARVEADPRVLPWEACPAAVASADRIVGASLTDLPRLVRAELVGASTCTHLSSTLRSLADARALLMR
jgi:hypothetical protein